MSLTFHWADPAADPLPEPGPGTVRLRILTGASASAGGGAAPGVLAGSCDQVAERISEYADLGIDRFLLVADDLAAEQRRFAAGVVPALERRGLVTRETPAGEQPAGVSSVCETS